MHPVMFAGTGSDVGKSVIAAAFCRIFLQDGYRPAPFKAQNMALNSYVTPDGLEIGTAQAVQAEAAGIECHSDMNPVLLKPSGESTSQVVLNGRPLGNQDACQYYKREKRDQIIDEVHRAYDRLSQRYSPIVLEGAGSVAEINLREYDFVNLSMAKYAGADIIIIADIDRGGVFASLYGTIMLLDAEERAMVKGIIINKFRGDIRLFESGIKKIEELCGVPVLGVVPFFRDIYIEEEDSVSLEKKESRHKKGKITVAVVLLPHISNFTDFNNLERDPRVHLYYSMDSAEIAMADIIIIPGTKNTLSDLYHIRVKGIARTIIEAHQRGVTVIGICGGYQMMGESIHDPLHIEGEIGELPGLAILPVMTVIGKEKITKEVSFRFLHNDYICNGYEIHMGITTPSSRDGITPLNYKIDGSTDGCFISPSCFGSYIHGILDNSPVIDLMLSPFDSNTECVKYDVKEFRNKQFDKLAEHIRRHVDVQKIINIISR